MHGPQDFVFFGRGGEGSEYLGFVEAKSQQIGECTFMWKVKFL